MLERGRTMRQTHIAKRIKKRKYKKKPSTLSFSEKVAPKLLGSVVFIVVLMLVIQNIWVLTNPEIKFAIDDIVRIPINGEDITKIKTVSGEKKKDFIAVMTLLMIDQNLFEHEKEIDRDTIKKYISNTNKNEQIQNSTEYKKIYQIYNTVLRDIQYFPISDQKIIIQQENAAFEDIYRYEIDYIDSWGNERTYKNKRRHEGTDIMDVLNQKGRIPIVSMTEGKVDKIGWNELGGWRVGITSPNGAYFYYAHLAKYASGLKKGQKIQAGTLIGYMGDTGYSKIEGTSGNFPVHLHLGIAVSNSITKSLTWVNPYPVLQYIKENKKVLEITP